MSSVPVNIKCRTPPGALAQQAKQVEQAKQVKQAQQVKQVKQAQQVKEVKQAQQPKQVEQTKQVEQVEQAKQVEQVKQVVATPTATQPRAKIMIGTPAYGGQCFTSYALSLLNSTKFCSQHNVHIEPCFITNESLIPRGRNTVVAKFLNDPTLTHLLFIDADVSWSPGTIVRLLNHKKDIVGAFYPKKGYEWSKLLKNKEVLATLNKADKEGRDLTNDEMRQIRTKLMSFVVNLETGKTGVRNGLLQVKHLGTGFMMIERHVLEKIADALPELKYDDDINILNESENKHLFAFFNTEIHKLSAKRHFLSEDYLFCKRWTDMGGEIFGDVNVPLTHTGTHSFAGHFASAHNFRPVLPANRAAATTIEATVSDKVEPNLNIVKQPVAINKISDAKKVAPLGQGQVGLIK